MKTTKAREFGISLVEVMVVTGIMMLLMATLTFAVLPALHDATTKSACASNLKQIVMAEKMYAAEHDGGFGQHGWTSSWLKPYLNVKPEKLYCPRSRVISSKTWDPYFDMIERHDYDIHSGEPALPLPFGLKAPAFDPESDALIKCIFHGSNGFEQSPSVLFIRDHENTKWKFLTGYGDGHVANGYQLPCWSLPYEVGIGEMYKREPSLVYFCDGTLEKSK